ncbi:hypothetical protein D3C75_645540 [compost metagenome]
MAISVLDDVTFKFLLVNKNQNMIAFARITTDISGDHRRRNGFNGVNRVIATGKIVINGYGTTGKVINMNSVFGRFRDYVTQDVM